MHRTGIGYDVHQFSKGRKLVLGGVEIPHHVGLDGHSDADVLTHAIADAILGALGLPDIGHYFPPNDPSIEGISSLEILIHCRKLTHEAGGSINNIDSTLIAEEPKIGPHLDAMKTAISLALDIETNQIGVKATTNETLGAIGRKEGIAAMAVASLSF